MISHKSNLSTQTYSPLSKVENMKPRAIQACKKTKIMIVDDSVLMRNAIAMIVETQHDFEVVERAFNGLDALEKLKLIPRSLQPDIILVDIEMPEMDGLTFLRHAKMRLRSKLVILSSKVLDKTSAEYKQAKTNGASAIISKPSGAVSFDIEQKRSHEIVQTIRSVVLNA